MTASKRYKAIETAQLRAVAFLFSTLLLLGLGKAFNPDVVPVTERVAIAYQAHTHACKALPATGIELPARDVLSRLPGFGQGVPAAPFILNTSHPFFIPGQATDVFVFTPDVKRCILFSCQKLGEPPLPA